MVTVKYKNVCDLCGQSIAIKDVTLTAEDIVYNFCCVGCQSIYKLIYINNREQSTDQAIGNSKTNNKSEEDN
jgi:hypothetical protein